MVLFLYLFVFLILTVAVVIMPWAGICAIRDATKAIKNPRSPRIIDNILDIGMTYVIGIAQIALGMIFLYIKYKLTLEIIREIGII